MIRSEAYPPLQVLQENATSRGAVLDETASEAQFSCVNVLESCAVTVRKHISRALMSFSHFIFTPVRPIPRHHQRNADSTVPRRLGRRAR